MVTEAAVEIDQPDAACDAWPVDELKCSSCDQTIGWVFWETEDTAGLSWLTTYRTPSGSLCCEDCAQPWEEADTDA
jgi:hypothetical protein